RRAAHDRVWRRIDRQHRVDGRTPRVDVSRGLLFGEGRPDRDDVRPRARARSTQHHRQRDRARRGRRRSHRPRDQGSGGGAGDRRSADATIVRRTLAAEADVDARGHRIARDVFMQRPRTEYQWAVHSCYSRRTGLLSTKSAKATTITKNFFRETFFATFAFFAVFVVVI